MIRFIDTIARSLPKQRLRDLALEVELSDEETYLLIERFHELKTMEQCYKVSVNRQREIVPNLDNKIQIWFITKATHFFSDKEIKIINKILAKSKHDIKSI